MEGEMICRKGELWGKVKCIAENEEGKAKERERVVLYMKKSKNYWRKKEGWGKPDACI